MGFFFLFGLSVVFGCNWCVLFWLYLAKLFREPVGIVFFVCVLLDDVISLV